MKQSVFSTKSSVSRLPDKLTALEEMLHRLRLQTIKNGSVADYEIVTERNLFQSTLKAIKDNELDGGFPAPGANFTDFDLKGTVACNSSFGYIFIEERNSKKQKFYRLGDMIGSSKLIKITRNMATFLSDGREITLMVKATSEDQSRPDSPYRNLTLDRKQ